jgi:tRNA G18 (ribose-2'-O)-methylase SpoU
MPVVALLDNIRSMFNVGSMFRTADGVWLEEIILCGYTAIPPRHEIAKTALGAEYSVPWRNAPKGVEAVRALQRRGYTAVALEHTTRSHSHVQLEFPFPMVFVVGNEGVGIQDEIVSACDMAVEIPQYGMKSSLNVAVAFGIMAYELRRQWDLRGKGDL